MTRKLVLTLLVAATPLRADVADGPGAARGDFVREAWTIDEGLPQNSVTALVQTRDGYLWLGTSGGLVRFDGIGFETFDVANTEGLGSNRVLSLLEDREGKLWIGTSDGGVSRYHHGVFTLYSERDGIPGGPIRSIAQDCEGTVWLGGHGLASYRDGEFEAHHPIAGKSAWLAHIFVDVKDEKVWFATSHGLSCYGDGRFTVHDTRAALSDPEMWYAGRSPQGVLWVGGGPIAYLDGGRPVKLEVPGPDSPGTIFAAATDRSGRQWVGGSNGLFILRDRRGEGAAFSIERAFPDAPFKSGVRSILEDREHNVWIGTNRLGLVRLHEDPFLRLDRNDGLPDASPYVVTGDGAGGLWVSYSSGEVVRVHEGRVTPLPPLNGAAPIHLLSAMLTDSDGVLWLAGSRRIARLHGEQYSRQEHGLGARVVSLVDGSDGVMWLIGRNGAIGRFRDGRIDVVVAGGKPARPVRAAGRLADASLWIASRRFLFRYADGVVSGPLWEEKLPAAVRDVHQDASGSLWISTYGGGLVRANDDGRTRITTNDGLLDNSLGRILEDPGGYFWINSNRGVLAIDPVDLNAFADGEASRVPCPSVRTGEGSGASGFAAEDGTMWFPTMHGLVGVRAGDHKATEVPPIVRIEKVFADGKLLATPDRVRVAPGRGDLEFRYTAPTFLLPQRVYFRYRLVGSDEDWIDAGSRRAVHYTNLAPGEYRFELVALNNEGLQSREAARVEITLLPHFYQTTWFEGLCALALVLVLVAAYRLRTLPMRLANRDLRREVEERRRTDRELRASREELQAILDNSAAVISVKDTGGRYLRVNRRYEELIHVHRDRILGKTSYDVFPPEQAETVSAHDREVLETGKALEWEEQVSQDDGLHTYISMRAPLFDAGGEVYAVCGISTDITDRKRVEVALHELTAGLAAETGEALFRSLVQHLAEALDVGFVFVGAARPNSPSKIASVAVWDHGAPGESFSYDLEHTPCADVMKRNVCLHDMGVQRKFPEDSLLAEKGAESYAGTPLTDSGDQVIGLLVVLDEKPLRNLELVRALLTVFGARAASELERQRSEVARRESESRFRTLVEHAPDAIVVLDGDTGKFVEANENATRLFGLSREELMTKGPLDVSPSRLPDGRPAARWAEDYISAALRGEIPVFEWCHSNARGEDIPCEIRLVRLPATGRNLLRGSIIDISDRKRAEAERRRLEEKVQQSARLEAVGRLAGGIAHDFNNILTVLMSHGEILAHQVRHELSPEAEENVAEIQRCSERAASLTRQLLAFSRHEMLDPRVVDPNRILADLEPMLRRLIRGDTEFRVVLEPGIGSILADAGRIEQVVMNLVINGSESMPGGGVLRLQTSRVLLDETHVASHVEAQTGPHVLIEVSDNGTGIPSSVLPHIFDPFFTTKDPGKGTGLGLASVHGIVRQSRGHVAVSSESGKGTTFRVYLPCVDAAPETIPPGSDEDAPSGSETILVCDDYDAVRKSTGMLLSASGYRVLSAGSAKAALRIAREHTEPIHLLVTDVVMPGMNGRQLASELHRLRPGTRVLFISAYTSDVAIGDELTEDGVVEKGVNFLEKPFTYHDLLRRVRDVLESPQS